MPATMLTCPGCKIVLKPAKPVPEGKKVKCPKCSTIFLTGNTAPRPSNGVQAKAPPPAPPQLKQETAEDEGWEIVEDDEKEPPKVVEAFKLSDSDDDKKPKLDYSNEPEKKSKKARKPVATEDDELDEEEEEEDEPKNQVRKARRPLPRDEDDDEEEDEPKSKPGKPRKLVPRDEDEFDDEHEEDDERDWDDDEEDDEEDEEEDVRPRRKTRPQARKRDSGNRVVVVLLLVALIAMLVLGTGIGIGVYWFVNRDRNHGPDDELLAYVPADCGTVMGIDLSSLSSTAPGFVSGVEQSMKQEASFLRDCKKVTGHEFNELFEYGVMAARLPAQEGPGLRAPTRLLILKAKMPFNPNSFRDAAQGVSSVKHKGKTFFKMTEPGATMMFMPSSRVLILSNRNEPEMQNLVEMDGTNPALPADIMSRARAARQNHNFWFVSAMDANQKRQLKAVTPLLVAVPDVKNLLAQIAAVKSIDFAMNVQTGSSSVRLAFICEDSAAATRLAKDGSTIFNKYFKGLGAIWLTAQLAGKSDELRAAVKELIDAVKFSTQGSSAEVSATISGKTADVLTRESGGNIRGPMLE